MVKTGLQDTIIFWIPTIFFALARHLELIKSRVWYRDKKLCFNTDWHLLESKITRRHLEIVSKVDDDDICHQANSIVIVRIRWGAFGLLNVQALMLLQKFW